MGRGVVVLVLFVSVAAAAAPKMTVKLGFGSEVKAADIQPGIGLCESKLAVVAAGSGLFVAGTTARLVQHKGQIASVACGREGELYWVSGAELHGLDGRLAQARPKKLLALPGEGFRLGGIVDGTLWLYGPGADGWQALTYTRRGKLQPAYADPRPITAFFALSSSSALVAHGNTALAFTAGEAPHTLLQQGDAEIDGLAMVQGGGVVVSTPVGILLFHPALERPEWIAKEIHGPLAVAGPHLFALAAEHSAVYRIDLSEHLGLLRAGAVPTSFEDALALAEAALREGDYKQAVDHAARASAFAPGHWRPYALAAVAIDSSRGKREVARGKLAKALELAPARARRELKKLQVRWQKRDEATDSARQGSEALLAGKAREAAPLFERAHQLYPENPRHGLNAATTFAVAGDFARARRILAALDADAGPALKAEIRGLRLKTPGLVAPGERRGLAAELARSAEELLAEGRPLLAEQALRDAIALSESAELRGSLGRSLWARGQLSAAEAEHRRALQLRPNVARIHSDLGDVLMSQRRWSDAASEYRLASTLEPRQGLHHANLAGALAMTNDRGAALEAARVAKKLKLPAHWSYSLLEEPPSTQPAVLAAPATP